MTISAPRSDLSIRKHYQTKTHIEGSAVYLEINVKPEMLEVKTKIASTETLGTVWIVDAIFGDPNAKPIIFNLDFTGARRSDKPVVGPIEELKAGLNRIKVWDLNPPTMGAGSLE